MLAKRLATLCATGWLLVITPAVAAPALPGDFIADLEALQQRLEQGDIEAVGARALFQAERLAGGNAADRWARALYLQLAAGAEARAGRPAEAAERLREARETPGVEDAQRDRWLRDEARLRLAAGQHERGADLLADWLARHPDDVEGHWRLARSLANLERWEMAADAVTRALAMTPEPEANQRALANAVYRRAGREEVALALSEAGLEGSRDPVAWREAAALAQQLGDPGRAVAIWETGWRHGVLTGEADLHRLVALHLAGGTPARAAEHLEAGLAKGQLEEGEENRRLLAQAWEAARDRERALAAWEALAQRTDSGEDWLHLGQLAYAWGQPALAERALRAARERGREEAERWLEALTGPDRDVMLMS
jgi:tetratricopeptide (TPR) repeat protein